MLFPAALPRDSPMALLAPSHDHGFSVDEVREILDGIHARGDRLMLWFLASHMALALALAAVHGTWLATIVVGGATCAVFALSAALWPRTFFTRVLAGVAQQAFVALHIFQLHGQSEQHFWYFTAFTMMIVYQDWRCMWPGALLIIAQHSLFAWLHNIGYPVHFFPEAHVGFSKLFFHFGIALVHVALCGYWAHLLRRQTLGDAWRRRQLQLDQQLLEEQLTRLRESEAKLQASGDALRAASRRQRAILDNSDDGLWVQDLDGQITAVNVAFSRMVGREIRYVIGTLSRDLVCQNFGDALTRQIADTLQSSTPLTREYRHAVQGDERILEITLRTIRDDNATATGLAGAVRDITERRRLEAERLQDETRLREAQKLESLGLLAGGIAHDFNNLLGVIRANAEVARDELQSLPQSDDVLQPLAHIAQATVRATDLTRQMLAYAGMGRVVINRLDVSAMVRDTASLLRAAMSKKVVLQFELSEGLPEVEGDATQLRQVVMNLISNAADAIGDAEGTVSLRTFHRELTEGEVRSHHGLEPLPDGHYIVVEVSDTGVGMSEETLRRIFDPFFTTKFVGRGLGLAAVLGILRAHSGGVDIASTLGSGTRFRVFLPVAGAPAARLASEAVTISNATTAAPGAEPAASLTRLSGKVLVVDDEAMLRTLAVRVLSRAGLQVVQAEDGAEALTLLGLANDAGPGQESASPADVDLVLLDMLMPRLNGEETLRAIRATHATLPVILTSGFSEAVGASRLLDDPYVCFVQKPYGAQELLDLVAQFLPAGELSTRA
jgi:PAS domain S-box-containing protein